MPGRAEELQGHPAVLALVDAFEARQFEVVSCVVPEHENAVGCQVPGGNGQCKSPQCVRLCVEEPVRGVEKDAARALAGRWRWGGGEPLEQVLRDDGRAVRHRDCSDGLGA